MGIGLVILTQLFDLQIRLGSSEERLLQANTLNGVLLRDEWLPKNIRQIGNDYETIKDRQFEWFNLGAQDAITECQNVIRSIAEGFMLSAPKEPQDFGQKHLYKQRSQ